MLQEKCPSEARRSWCRADAVQYPACETMEKRWVRAPPSASMEPVLIMPMPGGRQQRRRDLNTGTARMQSHKAHAQLECCCCQPPGVCPVALHLCCSACSAPAAAVVVHRADNDITSHSSSACMSLCSTALPLVLRMHALILQPGHARVWPPAATLLRCIKMLAQLWHAPDGNYIGTGGAQALAPAHAISACVGRVGGQAGGCSTATIQ